MEIGWEELAFFGAKVCFYIQNHDFRLKSDGFSIEKRVSFGVKLGAGAQGTVRKARWKGNDYAVKTFRTEDIVDFKEEVRVLEHLRHPNVVTFYGAVTQNSEHHAIVQELCLGSVYDYLQKFGKAVG